MTLMYWQEANSDGITKMHNKNNIIGKNELKIYEVSLRGVIFIIAYVMYLIVFVYWSIQNWDIPSTIFQDAVFPWVLSSFVINIVGMLYVGRFKYYDISLWFMVLSYLFMFGHIITHLFNFTTTLEWNPASHFSEIDKYHSCIYAIFAICAFSITSILVRKESKLSLDITQYQSNELFYIGMACTIIGFICNILSSFSLVSATQAAGSYASYTSASRVGILDDIAFLFIPGIIYLLFSKKLSASREAVLFSFSIMYFLAIMTLSGSRKTAIFAILALLLSYLITRKKSYLSIGKILILCLFAYLFLNLIYVIREMRFDLASVVPSYIGSLKSLSFLNEMTSETLTETGLTLYSLVGIISTVPTIFPYEYGMTIIRTIPSILPIGWAVGDFFNQAASTYVINRYIGLPVGASMIGDFYWNWGFFGGCIASGIFGVILSKTSNRLLSDRRLYPVYFSAFYIVLIGVRAGIFELFRPLLIVVFVPLIIGKLYTHYHKESNHD